MALLLLVAQFPFSLSLIRSIAHNSRSESAVLPLSGVRLHAHRESRRAAANRNRISLGGDVRASIHADHDDHRDHSRRF